MKVSQLIKKLRLHLEAEGDTQVFVIVDGDQEAEIADVEAHADGQLHVIIST